jgi:predicted transcriptional regulator
MTEIMDKLRDKDKIVLQAVQEGNDDIQKITETTILENHEVNYCFTKLEDLNLIHVEKPDGYTTRLVNGQKRTFQTPKNAQITSQGLQALQENQQEEKLDQYENLSHRELVEKTRQHEAEIQRLKNQIANFRKQVRKHLME